MPDRGVRISPRRLDIKERGQYRPLAPHRTAPACSFRKPYTIPFKAYPALVFTYAPCTLSSSLWDLVHRVDNTSLCPIFLINSPTPCSKTSLTSYGTNRRLIRITSLVFLNDIPSYLLAPSSDLWQNQSADGPNGWLSFSVLQNISFFHNLPPPPHPSPSNTLLSRVRPR